MDLKCKKKNGRALIIFLFRLYKTNGNYILIIVEVNGVHHIPAASEVTKLETIHT